MDPWPRIRRFPDGAIDYDFYRAEARAHRAAAIGDAVARLRGLLTRLVFLPRPAKPLNFVPPGK